MDSLLANIALQRNDIEVEVSTLRERLDVLYEDLNRLDKAEAAINGQSFTTFKSIKPGIVKRETVVKSYLTIKEMVLVILKDHPNGLIALDILSEINTHFNQTFVRTSLSPQLSRLKRSGDLDKIGKYWLLKNRELMEGPM